MFHLFSEDSLGNFILVTFCDSDVFFSPETCRAQIVVCNSRTCKSEHFHSMEVKFRTPSLNVRHRRKKSADPEAVGLIFHGKCQRETNAGEIRKSSPW